MILKKAVILAGGMGTRLSEETASKPKPMIEIGGMPILWHIMKIYSSYGIRDFIICCGYKGYIIKEYFANYFLHMSDVTFDIEKNEMHVHKKHAESWKVTLIDTGLDSGTGGRLRRVKSYVQDDDAFCFTYGDGLSDVNITDLIAFHETHGRLATVTAVSPPAKFGAIECEADRVISFVEKPKGRDSLINGGFFVLSPEVLDLVLTDSVSFETAVLPRLSSCDQIRAFRHEGFWQSMDTLREMNFLNGLWTEGSAPWKVWS